MPASAVVRLLSYLKMMSGFRCRISSNAVAVKVKLSGEQAGFWTSTTLSLAPT